MRSCSLRIDLAAKERDASRIGSSDVDDHSDRRGFAGAVRTQQSKHSPGPHVRLSSLTAVNSPKLLLTRSSFTVISLAAIQFLFAHFAFAVDIILRSLTDEGFSLPQKHI